MSAVRLGLTVMAIASGLIMFCKPAFSQDKDQVRNQAKGLAAQLRSTGEPKNRCSIGVQISDGGIVVRSIGSSILVPGDKLLSINENEIRGKKAEAILAFLRNISPDAVIQVKAERDARPIGMDVICSNSRPTIEAILSALDAAANGKFDDCVTFLDQRDDLGAFGAGIKAQCASTSKRAENYSIPKLNYDAIRMAIEEAHWAPAMRTDVVSRLRQTEGNITRGLGADRFLELVTATERWPGGEQLFKSTAPNIAMFRSNSESALRARLIDPESARIEWPYGFLVGSWKPMFAKRVEGYWTCGLINARNRMGGYTGSTSFVVVLGGEGTVRYLEMGGAKDFDLLTSQCNNSAKLLPPASGELSGSLSKPQSTPSSIADELKKLVDLRNTGALSEAEFQTAKQRLLGLPTGP